TTKIRRILADEGMAGLLSRAWRKAFEPAVNHASSPPSTVARASFPTVSEAAATTPRLPPASDSAALAAAEFDKLVAAFKERTRAISFPGLDRFYWYHSVDLGDGLVTPGQYDFRECLAAFHFPEDMSGMKVLDVGSATGFFAFECEKRGADVVA